MINVLWIVNIALPELRKHFGLPTNFGSGYWLSSLAGMMAKKNTIRLSIISYEKKIPDCDVVIDAIRYINKKKVNSDEFETIINTLSLEIIHIHGTENKCIQLIKESNINKTIISIQGIMDDIKNYTLPIDLISIKYPLLFLQGLYLRCLYSIMSKFEKKALGLCMHISGRTSYDEYYSFFLNPNRNYYKIYRIVRDDFKYAHWQLGRQNPYSITTNLKLMPAKGLHVLLKALTMVKEKYSEVQLNIIGAGYSSSKRYSYSALVTDILNKYHLSESVHFLGYLSASAIAETLLESRVFVLPSLIENNSNSLCEAMYIGMPCICASTGGLSSVIQDEVTGLMFSNGNCFHLAAQIIRLLENNILAATLGERAYDVARTRHLPEEIVMQTINMYARVVESNGTN